MQVLSIHCKLLSHLSPDFLMNRKKITCAMFKGQQFVIDSLAYQSECSGEPKKKKVSLK